MPAPKTHIGHVVSDLSLASVVGSLEVLSRSPLRNEHQMQVLTRDELLARPRPWNAVVVHDPCTFSEIPSLATMTRRWHTILVDHHNSESFEEHNVRFRRLHHWMLKWCYGLVDEVVAVSEAQGRWMLEERLVERSRLQVLPPAVPPYDFEAVSESYHRHPQLSLGIFGHSGQEAAVDDVVRLLREKQSLDCRFYLTSQGPLPEALHEAAASDSRFRVIGDGTDLTAFFEHCDAVICPSLWDPEGFECLEARAAGRPVLVPDVDALPEQAIDCGLVFHDLRELSEALEHLGDMDLTRWSQKARAGFLTSVQTSLGRWSALLGRVAEKAPRWLGLETEELLMQNEEPWALSI